MKKSFLAAQLALAVFVMALLPSPARAADNYIEGLSIQLEDYPGEVQVGETFTMTVRVVNQSDQQVDALLVTYLYGYTSEIAYPPADFYSIVLLNEGGRYSDETPVSLVKNENKLFTINLTVKPEVQLVSDMGASARLRVRINQVENEIYTDLAPPDNHYITLLPKTGPEGIVGVKLSVGVVVAAAIVYSFVNIQKHNNKGTRKRRRK